MPSLNKRMEMNMQLQASTPHFKIELRGASGLKRRGPLGSGMLTAALIVFVATLTPPVMAGSTESNLPALKHEVDKARENLKVARSEYEPLLVKLSRDKAYGAKFEASVEKNDVTALTEHIRAAGVRSAESLVSVSEACWGATCIKLPAKADDWQIRKSDLEKYGKELDAFLTRLSTDQSFAAKLEAAVMKGDHGGIGRLAKEGGLSSLPIRDVITDRDFKLHLHYDGFHLHMEW